MNSTTIVALAVLMVLAMTGLAAAQLTPIEELGKAIFFDADLSLNGNQSCASCHDPAWGWTGPDSDVNAHGAVYEGSIPGEFGNRKPPSSAYATLAPIFFQDKKGLFVGGNFWDGRATGEVLGNPAADQAQGPFLNPVEQALPDVESLVGIVAVSSYADLFEAVWGEGSLDDADSAFDQIALSIAAYEASAESNAFTSKFDYWRTGQAKLTQEEVKGFALFMGKGKCAKCHTANGTQPLFTDFTYDNLGVPKNLENPFYATNPGFVDSGLGGFLMSRGYPTGVYEAEWGKVKVPTLRNVDLRPDSSDVKAYGHNGYFKSLEEIVHFYNTRDVPGAGWDRGTGFVVWPAPEVAVNVNTAELGDLGLSPAEEAAIVAFMKTLSDGFVPAPTP